MHAAGSMTEGLAGSRASSRSSLGRRTIESGTTNSDRESLERDAKDKAEMNHNRLREARRLKEEVIKARQDTASQRVMRRKAEGREKRHARKVEELDTLIYIRLCLAIPVLARTA